MKTSEAVSTHIAFRSAARDSANSSLGNTSSSMQYFKQASLQFLRKPVLSHWLSSAGVKTKGNLWLVLGTTTKKLSSDRVENDTCAFFIPNYTPYSTYASCLSAPMNFNLSPHIATYCSRPMQIILEGGVLHSIVIFCMDSIPPFTCEKVQMLNPPLCTRRTLPCGSVASRCGVWAWCNLVLEMRVRV